MQSLVRVELEQLDLAHYSQLAQQYSDDHGAQVTFTGYVRQYDYQTPITHLYIEHYPQVTEQEILRIIDLAAEKWRLTASIVVHRSGKIAVGEPIVWVMTQSKHRLDAYAANEFIMDYLKIAAPFWKKEHFTDGQAHWVAAKDSDQNKAQTWASMGVG